MQSTYAAATGPISTEFADAQLGDARLTRRLAQLADAISVDPGAGFPLLMGSDAELEAFYRFMNNERVDFARMLAPHVTATLGRCTEASTVLVVHDTTEMHFAGDGRSGLGHTSSPSQGFMAHVALAVTADGDRVPLGVLGCETFTRTGTKAAATKHTRDCRVADPTNEALRWWRQIEHLEDLGAGQFAAIHVMDSEADIYSLMAHALTREARFIVRAARDDRLVLDEEGAVEHLREQVASMPAQTERKVSLSARKPSMTTKLRSKRLPVRVAREARVLIAGRRIRVRRPRSAGKLVAEFLDVNVVRVWEPAPPPNEPAVEWLLFTTEPVDTAAQLKWIVDSYRARWTIEEYFKALKSGCAVEKRQLESYAALRRILAVFLPIAWRLLLMRSLPRTIPDAPACTVLNEVQLRVLAAYGPPPRTIQEALGIIARLGGHLRRNGEPGWQTLGRGYERLLLLEYGCRIALNPPVSARIYDQS